MPSTTTICPRCLAEISSDLERCGGCNQILKRPASSSKHVPTSADSAAALESDTATKTLTQCNSTPVATEKVRATCGCGATIRVSMALRGKRVKCPKCSSVISVPVSKTQAGPLNSSESSTDSSKSSSVRPKIPALEATQAGRGTDSTIIVAGASAVTSRVNDDQRVKQEIEAATKLPIPDDALPPPAGKMSFLKLRTIRKQLETANVLDDAETVARRSSLLELGKSQDRQVFEILEEHAQDGQSIIREGAITAFGELSDSAAVPIVLKALLDRDSDVVRAAFATLKVIGDRRVVRTLLLFGVDRPLWRPLSIDTLVRLGQRVLPELIQLLHANDKWLLLDAIVVVGRIGDAQALPALIACLSFASDLQKVQIAEALTLIRDPSSVPHLLQLLQSPNASVRANAASGLVRLNDPRAYRPLVTALQDENSDVRRSAAMALGELGEVKAVPELLRVLQGWDLLVAMDAPFVEAIVETVGKLGDDSAALGLLPLLESKHEAVILKTVTALKKLRSPSAIPALLSLLRAPQPTLRRRVVETLGQSGDGSLVGVIGQVLGQDGSREVRAMAARALGELKSREASPFLENALREEFSIRCQAVIAMGLVQDRDTLPGLMAMLKDGSPEVRYHAINAIAKFKEPKTLKALAVMLEDADPMVRSGAEKVLGDSELSEKIEANDAVKQIVRRARSRNLVECLIPKWLFLLVPTRKVALSGLAGILLICLLGTVGYTLWVGPTTRVLVRGKVAELTMSPDGNTLVAERTLGMLEVWDVKGERVLQRLSKENGKTPRFRAKDGLVLVLGDSLVPWNLSSGQVDPSTAWKEHRQPIVTLHTTPGGEFAVTMDREATVVVWNLGTGRKSGQLKLDPRFKQSLTVSPKGGLLASSNVTGDVVVWNVETGERIREIPRPKGAKPFVKFAFNSAENWLVGAEQNGGVILFDLEAKSRLLKGKTIQLEHPIDPIDLRFLPDGRSVLAADVGGDIFVCDLESEESSIVCKTGFSPLEGFDMNSDGTQFAAGNSESTEIVVFSLESGKPLKRLDAK